MTATGPPARVTEVTRSFSPLNRLRSGWSLGRRGKGRMVLANLSFERRQFIGGLKTWLAGDVGFRASGTRTEGSLGATIGTVVQSGAHVYSQVHMDALLASREPVLPDRQTGRAYNVRPRPKSGTSDPDIHVTLAAAMPLSHNTFIDIGVSHEVMKGSTSRLRVGLWSSF